MQGRDALDWALIVVGGLVVAALVYLVVLIPTGTSAIPAQSVGDQRLQELDALTTSARTELTAFLGYDYKSVDQTINTVANGATGKFADDWQNLAVTFKAGAAQFQVRATVDITGLSVHQIKGDTATLLVAAYQTKTSTQTASTPAAGQCAAGSVCGTLHMWVTYQRVHGQWKMADLGYSSE